MSWSATLSCLNPDDDDLDPGQWNYTHNCNRMIAEALSALGCSEALTLPDNHPLTRVIGPPWWKRLDGCDGPTGARFLHEVITELRRDPSRYEAFNPPNGWGDYESLVAVLTEMRDSVPEYRTVWRTSG